MFVKFTEKKYSIYFNILALLQKLSLTFQQEYNDLVKVIYQVQEFK